MTDMLRNARGALLCNCNYEKTKLAGFSSFGGRWSGEYDPRPVGRYDPGLECVLAGAMESGGRGLPINVALARISLSLGLGRRLTVLNRPDSSSRAMLVA